VVVNVSSRRCVNRVGRQNNHDVAWMRLDSIPNDNGED
jgi:hypothetical protein